MNLISTIFNQYRGIIFCKPWTQTGVGYCYLQGKEIHLPLQIRISGGNNNEVKTCLFGGTEEKEREDKS